MITTRDNQILHRTRCLSLERAASFCRAINGNSRFADAEIRESRQAKGEARWFVAYRPSNPDRQQHLLDEQRAEQERRAAAEEFTFTWDATLGAYRCKSHGSQKEYETTVSSCSCPSSLYRLAAVGLPCKHQCSLLSQLEDGLVGEEEALEMAACEACDEPTTTRVPVHAEDGPASLPLCGACEQQQSEDAERAALPATPILDARRVEAEARRKFDQERFAAIFDGGDKEWMK